MTYTKCLAVQIIRLFYRSSQKVDVIVAAFNEGLTRLTNGDLICS